MSNIPKRSDEAAFPRPTQHFESDPDDVLLPAQWGLTKRELFAAMAMQGLVSGQRWVNNAAACADDAVRFADALLAELAKS